MKKFLKVLLSLTLVFTFTVVLAACNFQSTPTDQPSVGGSSEVDLIKENAFAADEQGVYTLTNGSALEVAFNKEVAEGTEWAWMGANLESYDLSAMNSLRLNVSGTCKVLVKIEGVVGEANKGVEVTLQLSSTAVAYEWDLSGAAEKEILANATKLIFFALPGSAKGTGSFTIANAVLSEDEAMFNPIQSGYVPPVKGNVYDGFSEAFHVNQLWESNDGNVYTITENGDGTVKFDFDITGWQFCATFVKGHEKFEYLNFKIAGEVGTRVTLKVEGGGKQAELHAWLTEATEDVFTLDLSALSETERGGLERVLFFATSGDGGKGSFVMNDVYFSHTKDGETTSQAPAGGEDQPSEQPTFTRPDAQVYWTGDSFSALNGTWYGGGQPWGDWFGQGPDVFAWDAETKTMSFTDRSGDYSWSVFGTNVRGNFANFSKITYKLTATEGLKIKFVVMCQSGGNKEIIEVTATGAEQEVVVDLSGINVEERSTIVRIGFYAGYQANEWDSPRIQTGSVQLHAVDFGGYAPTTTTGADTFECKYFFDFVNPLPVCTIKRENNKTVVDYTKHAGSEWVGMLTFLDGNLAGYTSLNYDVVLDENTFLTFKIEGTSGQYEFKLDGDASVKATGTGSIDLSVVPAEVLAGAEKVVVFANLGQTGVSGTFTINSLTFTK